MRTVGSFEQFYQLRIPQQLFNCSTELSDCTDRTDYPLSSADRASSRLPPPRLKQPGIFTTEGTETPARAAHAPKMRSEATIRREVAQANSRAHERLCREVAARHRETVGERDRLGNSTPPNALSILRTRASVPSVVRKRQTNRPFEGEFMVLQENYDLNVRQTPVVIR